MKAEASLPADLLCHIDSPKSPAPLSDSSVLRGWVAFPRSTSLEQASVECTTGNVPLKISARPDVTRALPQLASAGFEGRVDPKVLSMPPTIEFRFTGGATERRILDLKVDVAGQFQALKDEKLRKIAEILRCPNCSSPFDPSALDAAIVCATCGAVYARQKYGFNFLSEKLRAQANIFEVDAVSSHDYDPPTLDIISRHRDGLILDDGSGLRSTYYPNVVNFDVVGYDTTDVIGIGENMPFRDNAFDAVISVAVLEHVRDPFAAAREIERVLKPGGEVYIAVPFLQPFHGYPDHYYNMTSSGVRNLFPTLRETSMSVPLSGLPIWALSWMLNAWANGLSSADRKTLTGLKVSDLMADPISLLDKPYVKNLSAATNEQLACLNVFRAIKPTD